MGERFQNKITLFDKDEDKIVLKCNKIKLVKNGNIKRNARVYRINKAHVDGSNPCITDLIGFVSLSNYDLSEGKSTGFIYYNLGHNIENIDEYYKDKFLIKNTGEDVFRPAKLMN